MPSLFDPYQMGPLRLANRIVMAPMERSRARNAAMAPDATTALYFAQRAGAGFIITGSLSISIEGQVTGDIVSSQRVDLQPGGRLVGDVRAARLTIADGASFKGNVDMDV